MRSVCSRPSTFSPGENGAARVKSVGMVTIVRNVYIEEQLTLRGKTPMDTKTELDDITTCQWEDLDIIWLNIMRFIDDPFTFNALRLVCLIYSYINQ